MKNIIFLLILSSFMSSNNVYGQKVNCKVGDAIWVNQYYAMGVPKAYEWISNNSYYVPKKGCFYTIELFIDVKEDAPELIVNAFFAKIKDEYGYEYISEFIGPEPLLTHSSISSGDKLRAFVTFDLPKDGRKFKFVYKDLYKKMTPLVVDLKDLKK